MCSIYELIRYAHFFSTPIALATFFVVFDGSIVNNATWRQELIWVLSEDLNVFLG